MWIMTNKGFFSAVENRFDKDTLIVRARVKGHLESFFPAMYHDKIEKTPTADYLYRVVVPRIAFDHALLNASKGVKYPNFKGSVADEDLHDAYEEVWLAMFKLQCLKDKVSLKSGYMGYAHALASRMVHDLNKMFFKREKKEMNDLYR